jgi:ergothioneine biosynthesis protein EgtB
VLVPNLAGYRAFDPRFAYLFNSYYETLGKPYPRPERGLISRPNLPDVLAYRRHVEDGMEELAARAGERDWSMLAYLLELGLHHEQQHQELILMDIKHVLSRNPLGPSYGAAKRAEARAAELSWLAFPGGLYEVGSQGDDFAFDNEGPRHTVWLEPFKLASRCVTNGEYRAFIADGGYQRAELWLADGWRTINEEGWQAPLYWRGDTLFTLSGERPIDADEPVCHLSYFEADAFARWAGKRLPREEEWEVANRSAGAREHFASSREFHPRPAAGEGLAQMFGDVWEWTSSAYSAYPGFRPASGAIGEYNGKFMCGQFVLRGGAAVTPEFHIRPTYRNFFPPGARWAFAGVRLADDDN